MTQLLWEHRCHLSVQRTVEATACCVRKRTLPAVRAKRLCSSQSGTFLAAYALMCIAPLDSPAADTPAAAAAAAASNRLRLHVCHASATTLAAFLLLLSPLLPLPLLRRLRRRRHSGIQVVGNRLDGVCLIHRVLHHLLQPLHLRDSNC